MPAGQIMIMRRERRWFLIMIKNFSSSAGNYTPHLIRRWWKICNLFFHASTTKHRTAFKVEHSYNWVKAVKQSITVQRPWMDSLLSSGQNKTHTQPWLVFSPSSCRNCVLKISIWIRKSEHSSRIFIGELRNLCCCCWLKKELKNPLRKRRNMPLSKAHSAIVRHCVWSKSIRCCCESQPSADFFFLCGWEISYNGAQRELADRFCKYLIAFACELINDLFNTHSSSRCRWDNTIFMI